MRFAQRQIIFLLCFLSFECIQSEDKFQYTQNIRA
ncbi:unnamed protein product [Paramecium sonneborni]|uniref:Uncharacterized protein n=1 Tax=Paramecium sonneborni TaxID=65129 RepID=A0A8S1L9E4_9CILI|nr:unnamed protein product [Paramecium sonneborni]